MSINYLEGARVEHHIKQAGVVIAIVTVEANGDETIAFTPQCSDEMRDRILKQIATDPNIRMKEDA
jgi:hypothetical protein